MKGIRYSIITYPGYISLPKEKAIIYQINSVNIMAVVHSHVEAIEAVDFNNTLKKDTNGHPVLEKPIDFISKVNITGEYAMGEARTKRFSVYDYKFESEKIVSTRFYTLLMIAYEIADPDNVSKEEQDFLQLILSEFIHSYRHFGNDSRVRLLNDIRNEWYTIKEDTIKYSDEDLTKPIHERFLPRDLNIAIRSFIGIRPKESVPQTEEQISQNYEILNSFLSDGVPLIEEFRFLSKAFEEIDIHGNYKYGLLESFIVAESVISRALRKIKLSKGVSKGKLDDYEKDVSISYQINIEMPALLDNIAPAERQVLGDVDKTRKIRNEVVHKGAQVSEETALEALNSVHKLVYMLLNRNLL